MEHIALTMFLRVFTKTKKLKNLMKISRKKKVYTSDGINASDMITRVKNQDNQLQKQL